MACATSLIALLIAIAVVLTSCKSIAEPKADYCYANDDNPYLQMGTKTAYRAVKGSEIGGPNDCRPIQFWMLSRHGTRFPSNSNGMEMKDAIRLHQEILSNYQAGTVVDGLCNEDLIGLRNWKWDEMMVQNPSHLNEQGYDDLVQIAKAYKSAYPELFPNYTSDKYYFRHTVTQRTQASCYAFIDSLFNFGAHVNVNIETPLKDDKVIASYGNCQAWRDEVDDSEWALSELNKLHNSTLYRKLQEDVSKRLGYTRVLNVTEIESMFDNCRFDKSRYYLKVSPWCAVFTKDELALLEYENDVERFYKSGPGHEYNSKLGCSPLKHLRDTFTESINGSDTSFKTIAMFSHDTMLDMVFTALDYSGDGRNLTGEDYDELLDNRRYRTSLNVPFTGNMVAILHRCDQTSDYAVQLYHNQRPMSLPGCANGFCKWDILNEYLSFASECDLSFCDKDKDQRLE